MSHVWNVLIVHYLPIKPQLKLKTKSKQLLRSLLLELALLASMEGQSCMVQLMYLPPETNPMTLNVLLFCHKVIQSTVISEEQGNLRNLHTKIGENSVDELLIDKMAWHLTPRTSPC
jgi:hypothetical protein